MIHVRFASRLMLRYCLSHNGFYAVYLTISGYLPHTVQCCERFKLLGYWSFRRCRPRQGNSNHLIAGLKYQCCTAAKSRTVHKRISDTIYMAHFDNK